VSCAPHAERFAQALRDLANEAAEAAFEPERPTPPPARVVEPLSPARARVLVSGSRLTATNLTGASAEFVIDAYHQLWRIEKSFWMSKHDLQARPVYHHKRESIEVHLTVVFAALAVSHWSSTKLVGV